LISKVERLKNSSSIPLGERDLRYSFMDAKFSFGSLKNFFNTFDSDSFGALISP